jgi:hypothetical protein
MLKSTVFFVLALVTAGIGTDGLAVSNDVSSRRKGRRQNDKRSQRYAPEIDDSDAPRRDFLITFLAGVATTSVFPIFNPDPALSKEEPPLTSYDKNDNAIDSPVCQTQCVYNCQHGSKRIRNSDCTDTCPNPASRKCRDEPPPDMVGEPKLIPSRSIPGLYDRWQDTMDTS